MKLRLKPTSGGGALLISVRTISPQKLSVKYPNRDFSKSDPRRTAAKICKIAHPRLFQAPKLVKATWTSRCESMELQLVFLLMVTNASQSNTKMLKKLPL